MAQQTLKNHDFVEIEFTGKTKEGEIFDSNIKEDLKKLHEGHDHPVETKPFIFCLGEGMFLKSVDDFLVGKPEPQPGKKEEYELELSPDKAFGFRNSKLVQMLPLKPFIENNVRPIPGMMFNLDGRLAKIISVSGGRVVVDFNSPLAGKTVVYKILVLRKVEDLNEKLKAYIEFLFKKDLKFEVREKKLIIEIEKPLVDFIRLFEGKFKEVFNLELEIKGTEEKNTAEHEPGHGQHEHHEPAVKEHSHQF